MDWPRRKPTRVSPALSASSAASEDGADTAASSGMPASTAFCTSSNEARPETSSAQPASGRLSCSGPQPPADDLVDRVVPSDVLPDGEQLAGRGEQAGRVQAAGGGEHPLRLTQL